MEWATRCRGSDTQAGFARLTQGQGPECSRLRLGASLVVCWPAANRGRSPRGFFQGGAFPRFSLFTVAIPPEVCHGPAHCVPGHS